MRVYVLLHCIVFTGFNVRHSKFVPDIFDYQEYYLWSQFEETVIYFQSQGGWVVITFRR